MNESFRKNSASSEDYLELIYELSLQNKDFKAVEISKKLNISRASVSEALKKLSDKGYITYEKYKQVKLTEKGLEIALNTLAKHKVLYSFFNDFLKLSPEDSDVNACRIEHVITDTAFQKIKNLTENF